jgi:lipid-A-disaccharide synthase
MANLIAGKRVAPELIQHDFTATKIVEQLERLLPDGVRRQSMMQELRAIRSRLNTRPAGQDGEVGGAIDRVARITLDQLAIHPLKQSGAAAQTPTEETVHL